MARTLLHFAQRDKRNINKSQNGFIWPLVSEIDVQFLKDFIAKERSPLCRNNHHKSCMCGVWTCVRSPMCIYGFRYDARWCHNAEWGEDCFTWISNISSAQVTNLNVTKQSTRYRWRRERKTENENFSLQTTHAVSGSVCGSNPVASCDVMDNPGRREDLSPQASMGDPLQLFIKASVWCTALICP